MHVTTYLHTAINCSINFGWGRRQRKVSPAGRFAFSALVSLDVYILVIRALDQE